LDACSVTPPWQAHHLFDVLPKWNLEHLRGWSFHLLLCLCLPAFEPLFPSRGHATRTHHRRISPSPCVADLRVVHFLAGAARRRLPLITLADIDREVVAQPLSYFRSLLPWTSMPCRSSTQYRPLVDPLILSMLSSHILAWKCLS
jgi:hypothetical protein